MNKITAAIFVLNLMICSDAGAFTGQPPPTSLPSKPDLFVEGYGNVTTTSGDAYLSVACGIDAFIGQPGTCSANAYEWFYFEVAGPDASNVPVTLSSYVNDYAFGYADGNAAANSLACLSLYRPVCWVGTTNSGYADTAGQQVGLYNDYPAVISTNTVYTLELEVTVQASVAGSSAWAYADPTVTLDPAYAANGYSLVLGSGFSNTPDIPAVPELPALWMILAALLPFAAKSTPSHFASVMGRFR